MIRFWFLCFKLSELAKRGYDTIRNPHPEKGISSSIQLGIQCAGDVDTFCFSVCDQPHLTKDTVEKLVSEWKTSGKGMGCVCHDGELGNPSIFSKQYVEELLLLKACYQETFGRSFHFRSEKCTGISR